MNTATHPAPTDAFNTRQLWAAVSVLGVAVVALGASLVYLQARPVDGHTAAAALSAPALVAPADDAATSPLPVTTVGPGEAIVPASEPAPVAAKPVKPAAVHKPGPPGASATKTTAASPAATTAVPAATMVPAAVVTGTVPNAPMVVTDAGLIASQPIAPAPRVACANCGRVESVTPIERRGEAKGVGAVTGGVLGAVVGNQIGKGNGRALATVLGAVGGGLAGNTIEKNISRTTAYQVQVRMQDGSLRWVEQASAPVIGSAVVVEGASMRPADGNHAGSAPAAQPQARVYGTDRN